MERKAPNQKRPFEFISNMITFVVPSSFNGHSGTTSTSWLSVPLSVNLQTPFFKDNPGGNLNVTVNKSPGVRSGLRRTGIFGLMVILLPPSIGLSQERNLKVAGYI